MDAHHSCQPYTTRRIDGHAHPSDHLPAFRPNFIGLHVMGLDFPLFNDGLVHLVAVLSGSLLPIGDCAFIPSIRMYNRLDGTSIGQQDHHNHYYFRGRA